MHASSPGVDPPREVAGRIAGVELLPVDHAGEVARGVDENVLGAEIAVCEGGRESPVALVEKACSTKRVPIAIVEPTRIRGLARLDRGLGPLLNA